MVARVRHGQEARIDALLLLRVILLLLSMMMGSELRKLIDKGERKFGIIYRCRNEAGCCLLLT